MKNASYANLQRLCNNIKGDMSSVSSEVVCTFEEVYKNMDALDAKIGGITYNSETMTITIPVSIGSYNDGTIILK